MKHTLLILISLLILSSCSMQNLPVAMDKFVDNAELKGEHYSDSDWEKSTNEFEKLIAEYTNSDKEYTEAEKEMAARAMGRYHALLLKQGMAKSQEYIRSLGKILPEYLDGFAAEIGNSEGLIKSLKSLIDTTAFESSMEKLGSALENLFETIEK